jgi:uncharacterized membrane protein
MADVTKPARRTRRRAQEEASKRAPEVETDDVETDEEQAPSRDDGGGNGHDETLMSELRGAIRDAAIEVLKPVARQATTSAAKYAVKKGPGLVKDKVAPMISEAGGAGALAKGALPKVGDVAGGVADKLPKLGGKGGKKPEGTGRGRRLPVQEFVDVATDVETVYDQFTQFEDFPKFMHRVEKIEQRDETTLMWHENVWGVRRSWEAEIVEQIPCERIVWRTKEGPQTLGVITFHRLSDNLTRISITMDFQPKGLFEKTASGMRISRRALRSDLMRFKAFVEMRDEATGSWRGTIEEGEVRDESGEEPEGREDDESEGREDEDSEGREDEESEGRGDDEYEDEEEEEPEASEEEEYEDEEVEEDEEEAPQASEEDEEEDEQPEPEPEPEPRPRSRRRRPAAAAAKSGGRRR